MSKSKAPVADDVKNLFQTFGGDHGQYQERYSADSVPALQTQDVIPNPKVSEAHSASGLFKQKKSATVDAVESVSTRQAKHISPEVSDVVEQSYRIRLAASPWLGSHLQDYSHVVAPVDLVVTAGKGRAFTEQPITSASELITTAPEHVEPRVQTQASLEKKAGASKAESKSQKKHQIFVAPKPLSEVFKQDGGE